MAPLAPAQPNLAPTLSSFLQGRNSPLASYAPAFVAAGQKYGVDPRLLVSIAGAESSFATDANAGKDITTGHNAWGFGPHTVFPSWNAGIDAVAKRIGQMPHGSLAQVGSWYSPPSDNPDWLPNVTSYYNKLGGTTVPVSSRPRVAPATTAAARTGGGGTVPRPAAAPQPDYLDSVLRQGDAMFGLSPISGLSTSEPPVLATGKAGSLSVSIDHNQPPSPLVPGLIQLAKEYMGTPYSWGGGGKQGPSYGINQGANIKGFDCSSFVQFLYAKRGIDVGRTTYDQIQHGTPVAKNQLQPGDIVFFHWQPAGDGHPAGPGHEGLYIGDGQFIHSPHTGDHIRISSIDDPYYSQTFYGARRIVVQ